MIDAATISLILDIILYSLLGIIVIKALLGIKRGFWKSIVSFIVSTALYVLLIIFNNSFTTFYYNFNIGGIYSCSFMVEDTSIELTTIGETLRQVIVALASSESGLTLSSSALDVCDALAVSILAFLVFVIHIILVAFIIAPFISFLIYTLIVRPILGEKITKKHKLRVGGFLLAGIKATVTTALLITPFSALVNRVGEVASDREFSGDVKAVSEYVDAYNNSNLAKLFTNIRINGRSFDIFITDYVTTVSYGNNHASSFLNEVEMLTDILCDGIEQGIIDIETMQIDYTKAISEVFVTKVLTRLAGSPLITSLLPVALSIVVNMDEIKSSIDLTAVDWNEIDWGNELNVLSSFYDTLYDSGIMEKIINPETLNDYEISRAHYPAFHESFKKIDESKSLKAVMPYVMANFGEYLSETEFSGIFPTEVEDYQNISIGKELSAIFDAVMTISDLSSYILDETTIVDQTSLNKRLLNSNERKYLTIGDLMDQEKLSKIIDFLLTSETINGEYVENGETYTYKSSDGINDLDTVCVFNGVTNDEGVAYQGLLDSSLISQNIGSLLKFVVNSNEEIKKYNIEETINEVALIENYDWKSEVDSLLHIVSIVYNNEILSGNVDIFDRIVVNEIQRMVPYMDTSDLVRRLAEPLMTTLFADQEIFGLTAKDLYFGSDDENFKIGTELNKLLEILPNIGDVSEKLTNSASPFDGLFGQESTLASDLKNILEAVYNSEILNHIKVPENNGLNNFEKFVKNMMNNFQDFGFEEISDELLLSIREKGWIGNDGEIATICNAFESLKNMNSIKNIMDKVNNAKEGEEVTISLSEIETQDLKDLINNFSSSQIINNSMGKLCNKYFAGMMQNMGIKMDFTNVEDWSKEADNLGIALDTIKNVSNKNEGISISLDNLDISILKYTNEDNTDGVDDLGKLLKSIYRLQSLQEKVIDKDNKVVMKNNFGDIVYNLSKDVLASLVSNENDLLKMKEDFAFDQNSEAIYEQGNTIKWCLEDDALPQDENGNYLPGVSVIDDLVVLIRSIINQDSFFDAQGKLDLSLAFVEGFDTALLEDLLFKVNNVYVLRSIIAPLLSSHCNFQIEDINFDKLYFDVFSNEFDYLSTYNKQDNVGTISNRKEEIMVRQNELSTLVDIYNNVMTMKNFSGEGINKFRNDDKDTDKMGVVNNIMHSCYESKIFTGLSTQYQNETSVFEDIIYFVMDKSTVKLMTGDYDGTVTKSLIGDISNSVEGLSWYQEIDNLCNTLNIIVNINDKDGLPFTNISQASNLKDTEIESILRNMNQSYLTHGAVANAFNEIYKTIGILDFAVDKVNNPIDAKSIDNNQDYSFQDKVNLWNEDITHLVTLYKDIKDSDLNTFIYDESGNLKQNIFTTILPEICSMNNISKNRSDILLGIIEQAGVDSLITGKDRLEKSQTITKLTSYAQSEDDWRFEASRLDNLVVTNVSILMNSDGANKLDGFDSTYLRSLLEATFVYDNSLAFNNNDNKYTRGYLASEMVSSFLSDLILDLSSEINHDFRDNYTFKPLNTFEIDGLVGTIEVVKDLVELCRIIDEKDIVSYNTWKVKFVDDMTLMGNRLAETDSFYNEKVWYLAQDNSIIAEKIFVKMVKANSTITNNQTVNKINWTLKENQTFKEKAEEVVKTMDSMISMI